ncbi:MAG: PorV/PorQ family protein [Bacteroidota bacterium]
MKKISILVLTLAISVTVVVAGNKDRAGQAGAYELLINPWARSSGWHGLNTGSVRGLEAMNLNVGGLAFTEKTEVLFAHSIYLQGTGININAFGFSQAIGKSGGVLGLDLMAMSFGDIMVTTVNSPEGGLGTFHPQFINLGIAYSKAFSNSIYGGIVVRAITEGVADAKASGLSFDAGIQYKTGDKKFDDRVKFGISLRNVGTALKFQGDALTYKGSAAEGDYQLTVSQRSQQFELPSLLNIGASYDFHFGKENGTNKTTHRITLAANFTSHSFQRDNIGAGLEYSLKDEFMVRVGYNYEQGILKEATRTNVYTGLAGGFTFELPTKKNGPTVALDYSYRDSSPWKGTHSLGVRINL